jgi:NADH:ubiquinone reductase (H+-translocating)
LQITGSDIVFAIGDCAECGWQAGNSMPPRAQVASQQAAFMARQLDRMLRGKPLAAFNYVDRGSLVAISKGSAVGSLMGKVLGRLTIEGFLAHWAYRCLHFSHEACIQGYLRAIYRTLLSRAMKRVRPQLKLH